MMPRPTFKLLLILTLVFGFAASASVEGKAVPPRSSEQPNIVVILADDLGYGDLGYLGSREIPTPNIDLLVKTGVKCTNGYVSAPYCSPTRAGFLTGRYQQRFGHEFNPPDNPGRNIGLPVEEKTIADRLKAAGYVTGLVGKWHLGSAVKFHPLKRGFDEFFGFLTGAHSYLSQNGDPNKILRGTRPVDEPTYLTDAFAREAVSFIKKHKSDPFFLYLSFNAVHTPVEVNDGRLARFDAIKDPRRKAYAAMVSAMDEGIGHVMDSLKAFGLEENTLIFFLSDNGGPTLIGTSVNGAQNGPLRGSKRTTLEGGIHVPFVVRWKGKLPAGKVYDPPVIQLDILPTALAAAGQPVDATAKLDGVNLLPYLKGEKAEAPHDLLYWRLGEQKAIRKGDWKLVRYDVCVDNPSRRSNASSIRVTQPKLYNLRDDPGETNDLSATNPKVVEELRVLWQKWCETLAEPIWSPMPSVPAAALLR
jgi:arylsulfatase A-like enzyme